MVDSDGRIINAAGFAGFAVHGGPIIQSRAVLSLPDSDCTLTADQIVDAELHASAQTDDYSIVSPSAADILKYLTNSNARTGVRGYSAVAVNPGVAGPPPANLVGTPSVNIATFQTKIFVGAGRAPTFVTTDRVSIRTQDLSQTTQSNSRNLVNGTGNTKLFTLNWYILNVGGKAAPDDLPFIAVIVTE
jgi:hypothetical protein